MTLQPQSSTDSLKSANGAGGAPEVHVNPTKWVRTDEGLWSPRKPGCFLPCSSPSGKENLVELAVSDEEQPLYRRQFSSFSRQSTFSRQRSDLSQLSEAEMSMEIQEVRRQLSEAQEAAAEAQQKAAEAEARHAQAEAALAKEAEAAAKRKEKAAVILEEARQKRLSQQKAEREKGDKPEKAEKSEKSEKTEKVEKTRKATSPEVEKAQKTPTASAAKLLAAPVIRTLQRQGPRGGPSPSPKGIKTLFKNKREPSRTRAHQEAEAAAIRAAAEQRKRDLAAVLQKASEEAAERDRTNEILASNRSLQAQLTASETAREELTMRVERLSFHLEEVRSRQTSHTSGTVHRPAKSLKEGWRGADLVDSEPIAKRHVRRTTGAIFLFLMAVAGSALHLTKGVQPAPQPCARGLRR